VRKLFRDSSNVTDLVSKLITICFQSSLKSAADCCQTERQIQQAARGCGRIARVSELCL